MAAMIGTAMASDNSNQVGVDRPRTNAAVPLRVLVTGATGYIGGRLVPRLLAKNVQLRCIARHSSRLKAYRWPGVEIVAGDLEDPVAEGAP